MENKKQTPPEEKDKAWYRGMIVLGFLVCIALFTVIIILEFFPSVVETQFKELGVKAVASGGAALFILTFILYHRAYLKLVNMLLLLNCFLFATFYFLEIRRQIIKEGEYKALIMQQQEEIKRLQEGVPLDEVRKRLEEEIMRLEEEIKRQLEEYKQGREFKK